MNKSMTVLLTLNILALTISIICVAVVSSKYEKMTDELKKIANDLENEKKFSNDIHKQSLKDNEKLIKEYTRDTSACMKELRRTSGKNYWFSGIDDNKLIIENKK